MCMGLAPCGYHETSVRIYPRCNTTWLGIAEVNETHLAYPESLGAVSKIETRQRLGEAKFPCLECW
jgi:hypothetical protein